MSERDTMPDDVELLLPWYATGRLTAEEAARVEAWLEANPEARDQLALIREELDTTIAENEAAPTPRPGAVDRLMEQVAAEPRRWTLRDAASLLARLGAWLESLTPQTRGGLVAAGLVLVIAQAAVIGLMAGREPATFETAAGGAGAATETEVLVAFTPGATAAEINTLLADLDARIVDGPKPGGIFALALAEGADTGEIVEELAARDDIVSFAAKGSAE